MKRLVALGWLAFGLSAGVVYAQSAPVNTPPSAGYINVAPEVLSTQLRLIHGSAGQVVQGLAHNGSVAADAFARMDPAGGDYVAGGFAPVNSLNLWATTHFTSAVRTGNTGYSNDVGGLMVGVDKSFGAITLGAAVNGVLGDYDAREGMFKTAYSGLSGTLFGRFERGGFSAALDLGLAGFWGDSDRYGNTGQTVKSKGQDLTSYYAALTAAYRFCPGGGWILTPSLGVQYFYVKADHNNEDMFYADSVRYGKSTHNYVRTPLMLTAQKPIRGFGRMLTPYARVGITPEWHHDRTQRAVTDQAGKVVRVKGAKPVRWTGQAGLGVNAKFGMRTEVQAGWDFEFGDRYRNNMFNLGVGFSF